MGMMDGQHDRQHLPLTACYVVLQRGRGRPVDLSGWGKSESACPNHSSVLQTCGMTLEKTLG